MKSSRYEDIQTKRSEYLERYRFWSDKAVEQISFSNNLLLTISIVVFGYFFRERETVYKQLIFDTSLPIDWTTTIFLVGSGLILVSIFSGILLSLTRLYDFRLTRHISLTRRRAYDKGYLLTNMQFKNVGLFGAFLDFLKISCKFHQYKIQRKELPSCEELVECSELANHLVSKFMQIRKFSNSLGKITWFLLKCQFIFFTIGIFFYAIVIVIK